MLVVFAFIISSIFVIMRYFKEARKHNARDTAKAGAISLEDNLVVEQTKYTESTTLCCSLNLQNSCTITREHDSVYENQLKDSFGSSRAGGHLSENITLYSQTGSVSAG